MRLCRIFFVSVLLVMLSACASSGVYLLVSLTSRDAIVDIETCKIAYMSTTPALTRSDVENIYIIFEEIIVSSVCKDSNYKFETILKRAKDGDIDAQFATAYIYEKGGDPDKKINVKRDYKKAFEWYSKLSLEFSLTQYSYLALYHIGYMYENGLGVKKDLNKAVSFYRKSATDDALLYAQETSNVNDRSDRRAKKALERLENTPTQTGGQTAAKPPAKQSVPAKKNAPALETRTVDSRRENVTAQHNTGSMSWNTGSNTKPRMLILAFEDKTAEKNAPADAIISTMTNELHRTGIFRMLEREHIDDIAKEIRLGQSGLVDPSTAAEVGKIMGAQYVMIGAITYYSYSEKASGFILPVLGMATKAKTAYVVIDIRIVNVSTSEIVYTDTQTGEFKQTDKSAGISGRGVLIGSYSKVAGGLLDMAARNAVKKHVEAIKVYSR